MFSNLTARTKKGLVFSTILFAILFIAFNPALSFNPTTLEFWFGILAALIYGIVLGFLLNKYTVKQK
jgi:hypothetical protein